mgnify:CR=1 FL=1|jgi:hypothetical protein|tara:strand:+ start:923 stop:1456 length:534 start_codon:yes stop_codon:yes gene_type:complete
MKLPNSQKDVEELMKNIDWTRTFQIIVPILQPVIIGGLWLAFAKFDKRADAVSKFIAIAESIPTIDLNLPTPVVLASLYHSIDEALEVLEEVIQRLKDFEIPTTEDIVKKVKEEILPDPIDKPKLISDFQDCVNGYERDTYEWLKSPTTKALYVNGCLIRKGYTSKIIKEAIRDYLT